MEQRKLTPFNFFRLAHIFKFGRDVNVANDVAIYNSKGTLPPYVESYVRHIQETECDTLELSLSPSQ